MASLAIWIIVCSTNNGLSVLSAILCSVASTMASSVMLGDTRTVEKSVTLLVSGLAPSLTRAKCSSPQRRSRRWSALCRAATHRRRRRRRPRHRDLVARLPRLLGGQKAPCCVHGERVSERRAAGNERRTSAASFQCKRCTLTVTFACIGPIFLRRRGGSAAGTCKRVGHVLCISLQKRRRLALPRGRWTSIIASSAEEVVVAHVCGCTAQPAVPHARAGRARK